MTRLAIIFSLLFVTPAWAETRNRWTGFAKLGNLVRYYVGVKRDASSKVIEASVLKY